MNSIMVTKFKVTGKCHRNDSCMLGLLFTHGYVDNKQCLPESLLLLV
jgi:hypothetical protein